MSHLASEAEPFDITIVLATKGRRPEVTQLLRSLESQSRLPDRVLIVGTGSSDFDAEEVLRTRPFEVKAWCVERPGATLQRNAGLAQLRQSDGMHDRSIVIFFDDDFRPAADWIEQCASSFADDPQLRGMTGRVLADGVCKPALSESEAEDYLSGRLTPRAHWSAGRYRETDSVYGCNMGFLGSVFVQCSFDEHLPLYGWQEDRDITGQVRKLGRVLIVPSCRGVHLGAGASRTSDMRFGYSQIANVVYLLGKGTMAAPVTCRFLLRAIVSNVVHSFFSREKAMYSSRLRGNWLALQHMLIGRCRPARILELP